MAQPFIQRLLDKLFGYKHDWFKTGDTFGGWQTLICGKCEQMCTAGYSFVDSKNPPTRGCTIQSSDVKHVHHTFWDAFENMLITKCATCGDSSRTWDDKMPWRPLKCLHGDSADGAHRRLINIWTKDKSFPRAIRDSRRWRE